MYYICYVTLLKRNNKKLILKDFVQLINIVSSVKPSLVKLSSLRCYIFVHVG